MQIRFVQQAIITLALVSSLVTISYMYIQRTETASAYVQPRNQFATGAPEQCAGTTQEKEKKAYFAGCNIF